MFNYIICVERTYNTNFEVHICMLFPGVHITGTQVRMRGNNLKCVVTCVTKRICVPTYLWSFSRRRLDHRTTESVSVCTDRAAVNVGLYSSPALKQLITTFTRSVVTKLGTPSHLFIFLILPLPVLQHLFSPSVWNQSPVCSDWLAGQLCYYWSTVWRCPALNPITYNVMWVQWQAGKS